ncbi:MAG: transporter [Lachnospiraceae bacterium]|nr:transporter [Lachnospiraceae bacterium]
MNAQLKQLLLLQGAVIIYTLSGIMAKFAAGAVGMEDILLFFGLDLFFLGVYALIWQQMIKRFSLSVAYANRAMALLWSALWAKLIFGEEISLKQIAAVGLVVAGILIVNSDREDSENKEERA